MKKLKFRASEYDDFRTSFGDDVRAARIWLHICSPNQNAFHYKWTPAAWQTHMVMVFPFPSHRKHLMGHVSVYSRGVCNDYLLTLCHESLYLISMSSFCIVVVFTHNAAHTYTTDWCVSVFLFVYRAPQNNGIHFTFYIVVSKLLILIIR